MMKMLMAATTAMLLATTAYADGHGHGEAHVALGDVEWVDAPIPGVQLALAWGDDATGATWLIRMEPGVALPMHTHTSDYWGLSIEGTWVHIETDGTEVATGPGDYSLVPGGIVHADRCDSDIPCIGLLAFSGPRDVALAE
ncbi:cupin domain-containing protein [Rhodobacterales bacterium HKCCE3408]|nr:cupin domain-containing protein [Rhodobacterales bacterium HKCCE3408]